jgi:hypothetical protein
MRLASVVVLVLVLGAVQAAPHGQDAVSYHLIGHPRLVWLQFKHGLWVWHGLRRQWVAGDPGGGTREEHASGEQSMGQQTI